MPQTHFFIPMSKKKPAKTVAVIGASRCSDTEANLAEEVGRLLAREGVIVVCGGGGGVMEAVCRGAQSEQGFTVGILPGSDPRSGNPHLSLALPTGLGQARNALVVQAGQAVIAIGGSYGTLSEIGLALKSGRKVIGLHTWNAVNGKGRAAPVIEVKTPFEAVENALRSVES
jgi:hypothetical protein